ncbi:unnamed protein product, partial [Polarella glacialis]
MMTPPSIMCLMLLLATSAAGAVQPDRCEGDCKGVRAQVLLQTGSVGRQRFATQGSGEELKDVQRVASMSLSEESSLVEALVTEVLTTGQPLTGVQEEIIERLNESFVTETLPGLQKRHDSDQELLNVHAASFAHCDVDLETNSQRVSTLNSDQSSIESAHTECLAQEGSLQSSEKLMHEELTAYLKSIQSPSSMMPEQRAPTPAMDDFVAQNLEFFRSLSSSYDSLKEQISTVEAEVEAKTANCSEVGLEFDEKFCLWKTEVENAKSNYLNCRTEVGTLYRETLKAAHSNAEGRRADLAAVLKVQCYLRMLLDGTTQEKLQECNDAEHTSSALDIAEPQLLDLNQRVLDGLGAPGSQVQCTAAGSSDAGSLYGAYAAGAACKKDNWEQLFRFFKKKTLPLSRSDFEPVMESIEGAAIVFLIRIYTCLTKRTVPVFLVEESLIDPADAAAGNAGGKRGGVTMADATLLEPQAMGGALESLDELRPTDGAGQDAYKLFQAARSQKPVERSAPKAVAERGDAVPLNIAEVKARSLTKNVAQLRAQHHQQVVQKSRATTSLSGRKSSGGGGTDGGPSTPSLGFVGAAKPAADVMRPIVAALLQENDQVMKSLDPRKDVVVSFMELCRTHVPEAMCVRVFDGLSAQAGQLADTTVKSPAEFWRVWTLYFPALVEFSESSPVFESVVYLFKRLGSLMSEADPVLTQQLIIDVGLPSLAPLLIDSAGKREPLCELVYSYTQPSVLSRLGVLRALKESIDRLP